MSHVISKSRCAILILLCLGRRIQIRYGTPLPGEGVAGPSHWPGRSRREQPPPLSRPTFEPPAGYGPVPERFLAACQDMEAMTHPGSTFVPSPLPLVAPPPPPVTWRPIRRNNTATRSKQSRRHVRPLSLDPISAHSSADEARYVQCYSIDHSADIMPFS